MITQRLQQTLDKLRAMFQRRKGRDLDLYWALTSRSALPVSIDEVVEAFRHYMREEGTEVPRAEFVAHLRQLTGGLCSIS